MAVHRRSRCGIGPGGAPAGGRSSLDDAVATLSRGTEVFRGAVGDFNRGVTEFKLAIDGMRDAARVVQEAFDKWQGKVELVGRQDVTVNGTVKVSGGGDELNKLITKAITDKVNQATSRAVERSFLG